MAKHSDPDQTLLTMPSLRAVKAFIAAARHQNFTRAAEALCVTQAAISRQVKELEDHLGTPLFIRTGRSVELTAAGRLFFDAAQLSLGNIAQSAQRIRDSGKARHVVTLSCTPAFAQLWLGPRLPGFFEACPDIDLSLVVTQDFGTPENGADPDLVVCKRSKTRDGYLSQPVMCDVIYPVCTPRYLARHPEIATLAGLRDTALLNLSPFGRSQVAEHVDWAAWLAHHQVDITDRPAQAAAFFNANDYNLLIQLTLAHQGVALGWDYLVAPLLEQGLLVRPVEQQMVHHETLHYLSIRETRADDSSCRRVYDWLDGHLNAKA